MKNKKVSVIVPIYNAEKYIDICLQSILNQTYSNIELVLINDGSYDNSGKICESYACRYDNVIYVKQNNLGVSVARNTGLDVATGEYIVFVDSDDRIADNMIFSLVNAIEKTESDLAACGYNAVFSNSIKPITMDSDVVFGKEKIARYFAEHFAEAITSSVCCKLYKKSKISNKFDTQLSMGEDLLFNLGYVTNLDGMVVLSEALYFYNKTNEDSLTHNYKEIYHEQNLLLFKRWLKWFNEHESVNDIYVHYRIVNLFFKKLFYLCSSEKKLFQKLDIVKSMFDSDTVSSIQRSKKLFDMSHRIILELIVHKRYRLLLFVGITYCKLKSLFR